MTQQQLLLSLLDLDGRIGQLQTQVQRDGLSLFSQRRDDLRQELRDKQALALQLEQEVALGEKHFDQDTLLQKMLELEDLQLQLPRLQESWLEAEEEFEEARPEEEERRTVLGIRLQALRAERHELVKQLPEDICGAYDRLGRVDEIKQGRCRCRLEVPDYYRRQLRNGSAWICQTCGSVLLQNLKP